MELLKITIDGVTTEVEPGTTILQAARKIGGKLVPPAMCYHSKLPGTGGNCRVCLVKVSQGSERDPRPMPKLVVSCSTTVQHGMVVENTINPDVLEARRGVVEFLLLNHPLDCPICDQAGECHLQDLSYEHGVAGTRYFEGRRTFNKIDIGPFIKLHMTRCILCYRCTTLADQITDNRVHGVINRGEAAEISTYIENAIDNDFSGNMIDVCPVGALTDNTFRFKSRVWFLKPFNVHRDCPTCQGKAVAWMHGGSVYRITARKDEWGEIESFICNTCRFDKKESQDWEIEGPRNISRHSVIGQNLFEAPYQSALAPNTPKLQAANRRNLLSVASEIEIETENTSNITE
jgi:NADH-quinone oxidoreductase subunit G